KTRSAALSPADRELARADSLYGAGADSAAAVAYRAALDRAPANWGSDARAVESLLFALSSVGRTEDEVTLAESALPRLRRTPSAANVAATGLGAAMELPAEHPKRAQWIATFEAATREVAADTTLAIAADDRSAAYGTLVDARRDAKDDAGALAAAEAWASFLEREASRARTPDARAVFDSHRLGAYLELDQ